MPSPNSRQQQPAAVEKESFGESLPPGALEAMMSEFEDQDPTPDSDYGDSLPLAVVEAAIRQVEPSVDDIEDTPFVKFKNGTLSVTDLTGPLYCEFKTYFEQQIPKDVIDDETNVVFKNKVIPVDMQARMVGKSFMHRGTAIHESLEDEAGLQLKMPINIREEGFANKLVDLIRGLHILLNTGSTRELYVMGRLGDEIVFGKIDEVRRYSITTEGIGPSGYSTFGIKTHYLTLCDYKSRGNKLDMPVDHDHSSNDLQVCLYKDLLDQILISFDPNRNLISSTQHQPIFTWLFEQLSYNADQEFTPEYMNHLHSLEEPCPQNTTTLLPKGLATARNLRDLVKVLGGIVMSLGLGDPAAGDGRVSKSIVRYVYRPGNAERPKTNKLHTVALPGGRATTINEKECDDVQRTPLDFSGSAMIEKARNRLRPHIKPSSNLITVLSREVEFDGPKVYKQVASLLEFWHGQRSMKGPVGQKAMEAKCRSCAFYKKCPHVREQWDAYYKEAYELPDDHVPKTITEGDMEPQDGFEAKRNRPKSPDPRLKDPHTPK